MSIENVTGLLEKKILKKVKSYDFRTVLLLLFILGTALLYGSVMGLANFFSTIMATAHDLLINTVLFILAITVLAGAFGSFLSEFGILAILNRILAPGIKLLWRLPGCSALGAISTYVSDNPAIIALSRDEGFISYFEDYQKPALANFGTSFGMGLVVTAFMMSQGFFKEALLGNAGAIIGSIVSTRIMLRFTKKEFSIEKGHIPVKDDPESYKYRNIRDGNLFQRVLDSLLEGGKNGLEIGAQIVPGVLIICTMVLMMTFDGGAGYNGSAYQGIPILPKVGEIFAWPLKILFGFTSPNAIAFPITALGAVGAALALIPNFISEGMISGNDIAVFTAIGMCWSGYLSTHIAMMDSLGFRHLTTKAIFSHTIGGISAGVAAHYLFVIFLG